MGGVDAILMMVLRNLLPYQSSVYKAVLYGTLLPESALMPTQVPTSWYLNLHIKNTVLAILGLETLDVSTSQNNAMQLLLQNDTHILK